MARTRIWLGFSLLVGGIIVGALGILLSLIFGLTEADNTSSDTPSVIFIVGSVLGVCLAIAGIVFLIISQSERRSAN